MKSALLFVYTETTLHAGTGASVSAVDLPIQRERTTQHPIVQGSGVKGALRSQANGTPDEITAVFGPETKNASDYAGALSVGEARIVLFPVRSLVGVFAYVTCPLVLARTARDAQRAGVGTLPTRPLTNFDDTKALVTNQSRITASGAVVLEEFTFDAQQDIAATDWAIWLAKNTLPDGPEYEYWRAKLQNSLVILPDNAFHDFVVNSTEVSTHIKLDIDTKTVANGALWTKEALPADTLLMSTVIAHSLRSTTKPAQLGNGSPDQVIAWVQGACEKRIQLGGDETTGQGMVSLRWQTGGVQ